MKPNQQVITELQAELHDLQIKFDKVLLFTQSIHFKEVSAVQQVALKFQADAMFIYIDALKMRIDDLEDASDE